MANGAESYLVKRGSGLRTLYVHPAFPALLAGSFAVVLGAGSLTFPAEIVAHLLNRSGITLADAPLSFTMRATIAIASALVGTALGMSLARRLTLSQSEESKGHPSAQFAPRCRPIDVAEDVGEEGIGQTEYAASTLEDAPLDTPPTVAPQRLNVAQPELTAKTEGAKRRVAVASLDDLGLMQLTARLGASLSEFRKRRPANERAKPLRDSVRPVGLGGFEPSGAEEAARGIADFFAPGVSSNAAQERATELATPDGQSGSS